MGDRSNPTRAYRTALLCISALTAATVLGGCARPCWRQKLARELPRLGHRNWILIADSAYPAQSRQGVETIATRAGQLNVVKAVLNAIDRTPHVRARVYVDAEMAYVPEKYAPGIGAYREDLKKLLGERPVTALEHEKLIAKLDQAAKTFNVLVLKTDLALPYTSVFLELDCGYWSAEAEGALREAVKRGN